MAGLVEGCGIVVTFGVGLGVCVGGAVAETEVVGVVVGPSLIGENKLSSGGKSIMIATETRQTATMDKKTELPCPGLRVGGEGPNVDGVFGEGDMGEVAGLFGKEWFSGIPCFERKIPSLYLHAKGSSSSLSRISHLSMLFFSILLS